MRALPFVRRMLMANRIKELIPNWVTLFPEWKNNISKLFQRILIRDIIARKSKKKKQAKKKSALTFQATLNDSKLLASLFRLCQLGFAGRSITKKSRNSFPKCRTSSAIFKTRKASTMTVSPSPKSITSQQNHGVNVILDRLSCFRLDS